MSVTASSTIVQRLWNYCNVLRDDGISYGDYVERRLSVVGEVEAAVQAVLRSAFEGRLVLQKRPFYGALFASFCRFELIQQLID